VTELPARSWLERYGWLAAVAVAYLYIFPYFPKIKSANELPRVYLVKAIVDDHTFAIDDGVRRWGPTADVSPSQGHWYSNKAPGSSLLVVPAYALLSIAGEPSLGVTMWLARLIAGIVPMLFFLALANSFLERFAPDPHVRRLVLLAYAFGSMAMTYSLVFYSHQLGAICIASAWMLAVDAADGKRGLGAMAGAGFLAGASALVDYQAVFAAVPVAIYVVARLWGRPWRQLYRAVAVAVPAALVPIIVLLLYHTACFGSPWRTGYDASTTFAQFHQQGFLGLTELRWKAFVGSTVKIDNGLIALAPWFVLAVPGVFALASGMYLPERDRRAGDPARRAAGKFVLVLGVVIVVLGATLGLLTSLAPGIRYWVVDGPILIGLVAVAAGAWEIIPARGGDRGTALVVLAVATIYLLFISAINFWRGGWGVGPRYITALLPFLLPPIAAMLQTWRHRPLLFGAVSATILVGAVVYTLSSATFPYWPDRFEHPLYDVTFRLLGEDLVAPNLGSAIGVSGVLGIVPYVALVAALFAGTINQIAGWRGLIIATLLGCSIVTAYGMIDHGGPAADQPFAFVRAAVIES
jgi:hypothetical protein